MKKWYLILLILGLLLVSCNRPTTTATPDPLLTAVESSSTPAPQQILPSPTPSPTFTSTPTQTPPSPGPPTSPPPQLPEGDLIPRLQPGSEFTLLQIKMIDSQVGWGIGRGNTDPEHILRTVDGGLTWQERTPPQILLDQVPSLQADGVFLDADHAWVTYLGSDRVWSTTDGGQTWTPGFLEFENRYGSLVTAQDENHVWIFQFLDAGMQKVYTALNRTQDGGQTWEKLFDPYGSNTIQGFDKTGVDFYSPQFGWLTRDFRGVVPEPHLDFTEDGGKTWEEISIPPPPSAPQIFGSCACGLFDPDLTSEQEGSLRMSCTCYENDQQIQENFLYSTTNRGQNWSIVTLPKGDLYRISDAVLYVISREIQKSTDGGKTWTEVKTVNWDGDFSFLNENLAWGIAYDPQDDEYALVKTTDGCSSFEIIRPQLSSNQ